MRWLKPLVFVGLSRLALLGSSPSSSFHPLVLNRSWHLLYIHSLKRNTRSFCSSRNTEMASYSIEERGTGNSHDYRVFFRESFFLCFSLSLKLLYCQSQPDGQTQTSILILPFTISN